ncbi:MAG: RHS repeat protein, partial [bacterium]|nr:RHS repeat protein [bacterium]
MEQVAEGLTTAFRYDAAGNVTKVTDPLLQDTVYAYDALSRLTSVTQSLSQEVTYAYD